MGIFRSQRIRSVSFVKLFVTRFVRADIMWDWDGFVKGLCWFWAGPGQVRLTWVVYQSLCQEPGHSTYARRATLWSITSNEILGDLICQITLLRNPFPLYYVLRYLWTCPRYLWWEYPTHGFFNPPAVTSHRSKSRYLNLLPSLKPPRWRSLRYSATDVNIFQPI